MPDDIRVIAIDFDGCLCEDRWPEIGKPYIDVIEAAKAERAAGARLILWTCRCGNELAEAVDWCDVYGLHFDAVNENVPEILGRYYTESRKITADEYWDDRARRVPHLKGAVGGR